MENIWHFGLLHNILAIFLPVSNQSLGPFNAIGNLRLRIILKRVNTKHCKLILF